MEPNNSRFLMYNKSFRRAAFDMIGMFKSMYIYLTVWSFVVLDKDQCSIRILFISALMSHSLVRAHAIVVHCIEACRSMVEHSEPSPHELHLHLGWCLFVADLTHQLFCSDMVDMQPRPYL